MTATFGRTLQVHAAADRIAVANDDEFSIRVYDPAGQLLHVARQRRQPPQITDADFEHVTAERLARTDNPETQRAHRDMPRRSTHPASASVRIDREGNLWVEELPPGAGRHVPATASPTLWQVFDRDGHLVAKLEAPFSSRVGDVGGSRLLEIGSDYVLAVFPDELGVERVRLYSIQKSGA